MKLLSFSVNGEQSFGLIKNDSVIDLKKKLNGKFEDLKSLLAVENLAETIQSIENTEFSLNQ